MKFSLEYHSRMAIDEGGYRDFTRPLKLVRGAGGKIENT